MRVGERVRLGDCGTCENELSAITTCGPSRVMRLPLPLNIVVPRQVTSLPMFVLARLEGLLIGATSARSKSAGSEQSETSW